MEYLNWDCANKTLAWTHVTLYFDVVPRAKAALKQIATEFTAAPKHSPEDILAALQQVLAAYNELDKLLRGALKYHSGGTVDLLEGAKMKEMHLTKRIKLLLEWVMQSPARPSMLGPKCKVLIEDQPMRVGRFSQSATSANNRAVQTILTGVYVPTHEVKYISPQSKNTVSFAPHLELSVFLAAKKSEYDARKAHTSANLTYFLDHLVEPQHRAEVLGGAADSTLDHQADTILMMFAFHARKS